MAPRFIVRYDQGTEFRFSTKKAEGLWYRVYPSTYQEVVYMQTLPKNVRVLTPAEGDGLLIRADSIPK